MIETFAPVMLAESGSATVRPPSTATGGPSSVKVLLPPEVVKAGIEGEWLIPRDGAILVSLGAHTTSDAEGKAVIHERLMLLEAQPVTAHEGPTRR